MNRRVKKNPFVGFDWNLRGEEKLAASVIQGMQEAIKAWAPAKLEVIETREEA